MTTEAIMKQALDGWFFSIDPYQGKVTRRAVPDNYIPKHKPLFTIAEPMPSKMKYPWTEGEDETLLTMRHAGHTWLQIAQALDVAAKTAADRYATLCLERGIEPIPNDIASQMKRRAS